MVDSDNYDTQARDADYGPSFPLAWTTCPGGAETGGQHPNKWCHGSIMHFNLNDPTKFDTLKERRSRACHELGRPVGLDFNGNITSCMCRYDPDRSETLGPHDVNEINNHYP